MELASDIMQKMQKADINHIPVFIGGIIPDQDAPKLKAMGIKQVYTPKNFDLNKIMKEIVGFAA
jgi:(2R)-ethylmalonyl-CoA mutase